MTLRRLVLALFALPLFLSVPARIVRAQGDSPKAEVAEEGSESKPKKKKAPAKKKGFDYERSKYKSKEPSPVNHYRFNEKGDPVGDETKKKASKKKKRSEPPEGESLNTGACGAEGTCSEKKSDADAL
jgi:hypothetical protein